MDALLAETVNSEGLVDYTLLRTDQSAELSELIRRIGTCDQPTGSPEEVTSFWLNAYNATMLANIAGEPEVKDILADGFGDQFFKETKAVAGITLSLDQIENTILRADRPNDALSTLAVSTIDPRIHVGLNCGAVSCPALPNKAFRPETLDDELDQLMRRFVNSNKHFRMDGETLVASSLVSWFAADWDSRGKPGGDYLLSYMCTARPDYSRIAAILEGKTASELVQSSNIRFEYSWLINSQ